MKKYLLVLTILVIVQTSCNSSRKIPNADKGIESKTPFSSAEYRSDKSFFRAVANGKSVDITTAKEMAINSANLAIAAEVSKVMTSLTEQTKFKEANTTLNDSEEGSDYKYLSYVLVNVKLNNILLKDEKVFTQKDGSYSYWVAVEGLVDNLFSEIDKSLKNDSKLKARYKMDTIRVSLKTELEKRLNEEKH